MTRFYAHTIDEQYFSLMYIMYGLVSNITPSYTHIICTWYEESNPRGCKVWSKVGWRVYALRMFHLSMITYMICTLRTILKHSHLELWWVWGPNRAEWWWQHFGQEWSMHTRENGFMPSFASMHRVLAFPIFIYLRVLHPTLGYDQTI